MKIIQDYIPAGRRNRPMTNPSSSLYRKKMQPKYITIHNASSRAPAARLHEYVKSVGAANRPASWHFSIDEKDCFQALPTSEVGWHAGDNLGPGNTTTIGIEICDYAMLASPQNKSLFWEAVDHTARLCVHLIQTEPTLHPFPAVIKQHHNWSGKNCPAWLRQSGWNDFMRLIEKYLNEADESWPTHPIPKIQRTVGVEFDGKRTDEIAYLINNSTYVRALYAMGKADLKVTGHGDHIKIRREQ